MTHVPFEVMWQYCEPLTIVQYEGADGGIGGIGGAAGGCGESVQTPQVTMQRARTFMWMVEVPVQ